MLSYDSYKHKYLVQNNKAICILSNYFLNRFMGIMFTQYWYPQGTIWTVQFSCSWTFSPCRWYTPIWLTRDHWRNSEGNLYLSVQIQRRCLSGKVQGHRCKWDVVVPPNRQPDRHWVLYCPDLSPYLWGLCCEKYLGLFQWRPISWEHKNVCWEWVGLFSIEFNTSITSLLISSFFPSFVLSCLG